MEATIPSGAATTQPPSLHSKLRSLIGYGLPILAFAAAGAAAYLIKNEKEHSSWAFDVAVVAAITTFLTAALQHLQERKTSQLTERLTQLVEENTRLSAAIQGGVTGGDSFAMAYFPKKDGRHWLTLRHFGDYTLRDIRITVQDFQPHPLHLNFAYPSLPPNAIEPVRPFEFRVDRLALQVSFLAPNGWWAETVKAVRKDGELIFALRAWRPSTDGTLQFITLHEDVHPEFPREPNGQIDWSVGTVDISKSTPSNESSEDFTRRMLGQTAAPSGPAIIENRGVRNS